MQSQAKAGPCPDPSFNHRVLKHSGKAYIWPQRAKTKKGYHKWSGSNKRFGFEGLPLFLSLVCLTF